MIDIVRLLLRAGDGGHGKVAFHREKFVLKGGPDGGDGGNGGSVIIRATRKHTTLAHFAGVKAVRAGHGGQGGKKKQHGPNGEDEVIEVPLGTIVWQVEGKNASTHKHRRRYYVEKEGENIPNPSDRSPLDVPAGFDSHAFAKQEPGLGKEPLARLLEEGQEFVVCRGGHGGRGNVAFKSSVNTTPLEAEWGDAGQQRLVVLELELLADVGLVGLPNAGKSTFISRITKARPKIANYPFTTLSPNLGIWKLSGDGDTEHQAVVVADIPGLIEGASQGKGLGHDFLRHIKACQMLLIFVYLPEEVAFDESISTSEKVKQAWDQYVMLAKELSEYSLLMDQKPQVVVLNKIDVYSEELRNALEKYFAQHLPSSMLVIPISAATAEGVERLTAVVRPLIQQEREENQPAE